MVPLSLVNSGTLSSKNHLSNIDVLFIGTTQGHVKVMYTLHDVEGRRTMDSHVLNEFHCEIKGMDALVLHSLQFHSSQFGIGVYVLSARSVTLLLYQATVSNGNELTLTKLHQLDLPHLIRDVSRFSVEKSPLEQVEHLPASQLPQRVIVYGENEMEVIVVCPKILSIFESNEPVDLDSGGGIENGISS
ncbi:hypothetical protein PMAYCL1PPCAC_24153 [Pristionchus mayeri]|uniref:Uncharacterized protein n=1 Tax=Pristionchus mayeri TaxID=1317129 RepID=A0AAN5CZM6_9BILA|nr:hypothetical protein PMAYCL1PPCAC_24153 [Pristionchus mayeri]